MSALINHLWQSTLFAAVVALLALALRGNRAQARYWLWLAASAKFLVPFSLLMRVGGGLAFQPAVRVTTERPVATAVAQVTDVLLPVEAVSGNWLAYLGALWFVGFVATLVVWGRRWRALDAARRAGRIMETDAAIPIVSTPALVEPGIFGIWKPVLLLPQGIENALVAEQLQAIVAHEMCHVKRRDNLLGLGQMAVEALFWFHPAVWWIGTRLAEERERACDEEVMRQGNRPDVYAEGILNVCRYYLQSPLACAPGVTGGELKQRIREILSQRTGTRMTLGRKAILAAAGSAALLLPVLVGIVRAQGPLAFDVASIRPSEPGQQNSRFNIVPGGGINVSNVPVRRLIEFAYGVRQTQIIGAPGWTDTAAYDIVARVDKGDGPVDLRNMTDAERNATEQKIQLRTQALLRDRFQLVVKNETREMSVMALTVSKGGMKIKPNPAEDTRPPNTRMGRGSLNAQRVPMSRLAQGLSRLLQQTVVDETGVSGEFDFELKWSPDSAPEAEGPSLYAALQEKLGLKLESKKAPVPVIVIERVERPTGN